MSGAVLLDNLSIAAIAAVYFNTRIKVYRTKQKNIYRVRK